MARTRSDQTKQDWTRLDLIGHNLNKCVQFGQVWTIWTSVYNLVKYVQFGQVWTIWTSV